MSAPTIFISYAREDDAQRNELRKHLRPWTGDGRLRIWDDRAIDGGTEWEPELLRALDKAAVIVFLVSADLLDSDFVHKVELPRALERRRRDETVLIPVILRSCPWRETALGKLQALRDGEPIPKDHPDPAWTEIAPAIANAALAPAVEEPEPVYPDERTRDLSLTLADAYRREEELATSGGDPTTVRREILKIKREMREDGLAPGDLLSGRYKLLEEVGQGGFAKVWKAWDRSMRCEVAVKVLHQQYGADRTRRQRFFRGAKQMARLTHPGIVRILGEPERRDHNCRYFVMEYVEGGDLRSAVLSGNLKPADRLRIIREVGAALEYAHGEGIVHRDVKPANILLDGQGQAKLTDFDLVRAQDSTGGTRTGMLGTVVYAAPEAMERAKEAGLAADVFGLGMTAVFALHGADLPARELLRDAPGFARRLSTSEAIRAALARAVAWEPEERHQSVAGLCASLLTETPPRNQPVPPPIRTKPGDLEELIQWIETPIDGRVPLWREIPAGAGWIGSPEGEGHSDEHPRHRVEILSPFLMSAVPVTVAQYAALDSDHDTERSPSLPVVNISWKRAIAFCDWLAKKFAWARGARLPTEEEWEYACRAGTETRYWRGDSEEDLAHVGWYSDNSGNRVHAVAEKPASPWGLYDVHGNIWEWTLSLWRPEYSKQTDGLQIDPTVDPANLAGSASAGRVVRGGSCWDGADGVRSAYRGRRDPRFEGADRGFRVLIPLTPDPSPGRV